MPLNCKGSKGLRIGRFYYSLTSLHFITSKPFDDFVGPWGHNSNFSLVRLDLLCVNALLSFDMLPKNAPNMMGFGQQHGRLNLRMQSRTLRKRSRRSLKGKQQSTSPSARGLFPVSSDIPRLTIELSDAQNRLYNVAAAVITNQSSNIIFAVRQGYIRTTAPLLYYDRRLVQSSI